MSVLIKGMAMPTNCEKCPFLDFEEGFCFASGVKGKSGWYKFVLCPGSIKDGRHDDCPLIELPPHGDLIDRDALSKSLDALCDRVCQYSKAQRKVMCSACPLGDAFTVIEDDAPAILEAEEGE